MIISYVYQLYYSISFYIHVNLTSILYHQILIINQFIIFVVFYFMFNIHHRIVLSYFYVGVIGVWLQCLFIIWDIFSFSNIRLIIIQLVRRY